MKKLLTLFGLTLSLGACGSASTLLPSPQVSVEVGKPTLIHELKYLKMYSEKPFEDATLYYYDNGLYKIISPGEEHYGVYVIQGAITDATYTINYMSLPSSDWGGNVAKHDLVFHTATGQFQQQALAQVDQKIPAQFGTFTARPNTVENPAPVNWGNRGGR